jgi:DNA-binding NarL/FixJ family response regulator
MKIRVFLVDNHTVLRQGLRLLIDAQADMLVVGEAGGGRGLTDAVTRAAADVVVMDISMPDLSGIRATEELQRMSINAKVLALTRHSEHGYLQQMLQAGARGYALKQTAAETLIEAIRTLAHGGMYFDPAVAAKVTETFAGRRSPARSPDRHSLTSREQQIVTVVAQGYTNKEIASSLGITVKTVESHKTRIMQKLGITSRAGLVRFAILQGWLDASTVT